MLFLEGSRVLKYLCPRLRLSQNMTVDIAARLHIGPLSYLNEMILNSPFPGHSKQRRKRLKRAERVPSRGWLICLSAAHGPSARMKRNLLIKTKMPVCLRTFFLIRIQTHWCAPLGIQVCLLLGSAVLSLLPPCVWQCCGRHPAAVLASGEVLEHPWDRTEQGDERGRSCVCPASVCGAALQLGLKSSAAHKCRVQLPKVKIWENSKGKCCCLSNLPFH